MTPSCITRAFAPWTIASSTAAPASALLRKISTISAAGSTSASVATTGAPWIVLPNAVELTAILRHLALCDQEGSTPFEERAGLGEAPTMAMRRGRSSRARISASSLIAIICPFAPQAAPATFAAAIAWNGSPSGSVPAAGRTPPSLAGGCPSTAVRAAEEIELHLLRRAASAPPSNRSLTSPQCGQA